MPAPGPFSSFGVKGLLPRLGLAYCVGRNPQVTSRFCPSRTLVAWTPGFQGCNGLLPGALGELPFHLREQHRQHSGSYVSSGVLWSCEHVPEPEFHRRPRARPPAQGSVMGHTNLDCGQQPLQGFQAEPAAAARGRGSRVLARRPGRACAKPAPEPPLATSRLPPLAAASAALARADSRQSPKLGSL